MTSSAAHIRASEKWRKEHNDLITLKLRKETYPTKEQIKAAAEADGVSVNAWIIDAIMRKL